jgi:putative transcriptional regulator
MSKRNLFRELAQGIDEMRCFDQDKRRCARTGCGQAHALCGRCHDCRNPRAAQRFARGIRADACRCRPRMLENWKQGRAKPNAQAAALS